jgi:DNA-binding SARP family transcriptional activator
MAAHFRVLGPVEAVVDGSSVALGAPKQRALLGLLLINRRRLVSAEALIDGLWGERPPASATQSLQVYVHGLRRAVGAGRIETVGRGYRAVVAEEELDLDRFERSVERGRAALEAGRAYDAADELREALAIWRGPALADLPEETRRAEAEPLEELRLTALELRYDAELASGRHDAVVPELEALTAEEPFRERFLYQRMLALYRAGRQAEALEVYRDARRALADELGLDPSPALQELERAILRQDPDLAAPPPLTRSTRPLPVPPTPLVGRRLELAAVSALFRDEGARLVTLTGPGGTGKTRLGLAVAQALEPELRDGALFVGLAPVSAPELLVPTIAEALGVREGDRRLAEGVTERRRACSCSRRAAPRSGSRPSTSIPCRPSRRPMRPSPSRRSSRRTRSDCSRRGRTRPIRSSSSTRRTLPKSHECARAWTACRSRSSWRRRARSCLHRARSWSGSSASRSCSAPGRATLPRDSRRSRRRSAGATTCSGPKSASRLPASACSSGASRWKPQRPCAT